MALFYVAVAENIRGAPKPKLDLADVQQGDILNAMERFNRALSKGASGLQLPDNFKNADGSFISIPHTMEVVDEAEEKRKLAAPVAPTQCTGTGASTPEVHTIGTASMTFNYKTTPSFVPAPTSSAQLATMIANVATSFATGEFDMCMYLDVDVGKQGLNWNTATNSVATASIDLSGGNTDKLSATCNNCYAVMGGKITYKVDCAIKVQQASQSSCTVKMFVGGGVKFNLDVAVTKLNLSADVVNKNIFSGSKTEVFYDPSTSISISVTPNLSVGFKGTAVATGALRLQTSMDSSVALGVTCAAPAGTLNVGYTGGINLVEPTITSNLVMATYDLELSVTPDLVWTIGAGEMITADNVGSRDCQSATGMAVVVNIPNPMSFNWQFTQTTTTLTSKVFATVGFLVKDMNSYLAVNYEYPGSTTRTLYDYSKWPGNGIDTVFFVPVEVQYTWPMYSSSAAPTTVTLGSTVTAAVSLTKNYTPPAPAPAPTATSAATASSGGGSTGAIVGAIVGVLVLGGIGGYYFYNQKQALAKQTAEGSPTGLDLNKI